MAYAAPLHDCNQVVLLRPQTGGGLQAYALRYDLVGAAPDDDDQAEGKP